MLAIFGIPHLLIYGTVTSSTLKRQSLEIPRLREQARVVCAFFKPIRKYEPPSLSRPAFVNVRRWQAFVFVRGARWLLVSQMCRVVESDGTRQLSHSLASLLELWIYAWARTSFICPILPKDYTFLLL